jgi:hypothetical protein
MKESSARTWLVTAHALERWVERVHRGITFRQACRELQTALDGAHYVRELPGGLQYWRGPKPRRVRIRVRDVGSSLEVVTVIPAFDGLDR